MAHGLSREQPLDTDATLGGNSDYIAASQKATKAYIDAHKNNVSNPHSVTAAQAAAIPNDGWIAISATGTSGTLDAPSFEISFNADMTAIIGLGDRIKITQSTVKYFIVTKVGAFGSGATIITCYGGTDYALVATATTAITLPFVSHVKNPFGFPATPAKWSVTVTDVNNRQQLNPVQNTWYNLGSVSIVIPIGVWRVKWEQALYADRAAAGAVSAFTTLSTANNSESDVSSTRQIYVTAVTGVQLSLVMAGNLYSLTSKATYYINSKTNQASCTTLLSVNFTGQTLIIEAVCAYL